MYADFTQMMKFLGLTICSIFLILLPYEWCIVIVQIFILVCLVVLVPSFFTLFFSKKTVLHRKCSSITKYIYRTILRLKKDCMSTKDFRICLLEMFIAICLYVISKESYISIVSGVFSGCLVAMLLSYVSYNRNTELFLKDIGISNMASTYKIDIYKESFDILNKYENKFDVLRYSKHSEMILSHLAKNCEIVINESIKTSNMLNDYANIMTGSIFSNCGKIGKQDLLQKIFIDITYARRAAVIYKLKIVTNELFKSIDKIRYACVDAKSSHCEMEIMEIQKNFNKNSEEKIFNSLKSLHENIFSTFIGAEKQVKKQQVLIKALYVLYGRKYE